MNKPKKLLTAINPKESKRKFRRMHVSGSDPNISLSMARFEVWMATHDKMCATLFKLSRKEIRLLIKNLQEMEEML